MRQAAQLHHNLLARGRHLRRTQSKCAAQAARRRVLRNAARIARKLAAQNDGRKPDGKKLSIGEELAEEQKKEKALKKRSELS